MQFFGYWTQLNNGLGIVKSKTLKTLKESLGKTYNVNSRISSWHLLRISNEEKSPPISYSPSVLASTHAHEFILMGFLLNPAFTLSKYKINVKLFGGVKYYSYLCITESVINPTGGATEVGESGLQPALIFFIKPRPLLRICKWSVYASKNYS